MKVRWMTLTRLLFLLVAGVVGFGGFVPQATYAAGGNTAQLRVFMFERDDRRTPDLDSYDTICSSTPVSSIKTVVGENQRGDWSTWDAATAFCEDTGYPGASQISNWWWRFDKTVTITLADGNVITVTRHTNKAWLNVGIKYVHLNIAGARSPGYSIDVTQYESSY